MTQVLPVNKSVLDKYCNNDCTSNFYGIANGVACSSNTGVSGGCKATVFPTSNVCVSTAPDPTCGEFGLSAKITKVNFSLPRYVLSMQLTDTFNDAGLIYMNGNLLRKNFHTRCKAMSPGEDTWTTPETIDVPLNYLNFDASNEITLVTCNCNGNSGVTLDVLYDYVEKTGCPGDESIPIGAGDSWTDPVIGNAVPDSVTYMDSMIPRAFHIAVKECDGSDIAAIARAIGRYERPEYATGKCDAGKMPGCEDYNPYGPATVAILTTEEGLDLNNPEELRCAGEQLATAKAECPNCFTSLYVGKTNLASIKTAFQNSFVQAYADSASHSAYLNSYTGDVCKEICEIDALQVSIGCKGEDAATCLSTIVEDKEKCITDCSTCNIDNVLNEKIAMSKWLFYSQGKLSFLLDVGAKIGKDSGICEWTDEQIVSAYTDFYDTWIPIMAGSGIIGAAQNCYQDPCIKFDQYGLYTESNDEKNWTKTWFKEGCGNYYYKAEGLSPLTFSATETNYSMCDPSKMFAVLQQMKCLTEESGVDTSGIK
jgi:hypothetical protein